MIDEWIGLISNVGFPILAFLLMWQFSTKTVRANTDAINKMVDELRRRMR